ncbi:MAG TPA: N-6 DNA methylase [Thermoanaerobaculia bacterium]|jgi:hypothetical protein
MAVTDRTLSDRMRAYGCPGLIPLDVPLKIPEQIEYLDLLPQGPSVSGPSVNAVAEHQGTALLYLLDAGPDTKGDAVEIGRLQRQLANRSDPAWLGVARPGSLEIHPIGFHEDGSAAPVVTISELDRTAPLFFQRLVHGALAENDQLAGSDYVFKKIYGLLEQTIDEFVGTNERPRIQPLDILSMAGRALFFRFLVDRKIVLENERPDICPAADGLKDAFANAEKAAQTSAWLDETFNGDFLQLVDESIPAADRAARQEAYLRFYEGTRKRAGILLFNHLHAILNGWRATQGGMQLTFDWGDLDFAHIPVGVLSQVYESFSHRAEPRDAAQTSIHYTPRSIARLMVDQTFAAATNRAEAKVLDPACGAGIFLVLAFRRLVSERWRVDGKRPDTRTIQRILYNQVRGFDVSQSALRLAALALYITAIEVNGAQRPPKALKFPRDLRNEVLYYFGDDSEATASKGGSQRRAAFTLGSLGPKVPEKFDGQFDIVIGNPPWARLREPKQKPTEKKRAFKTATDVLNEEFTKIGRRVLLERGLPELARTYENPDKNPDVPFVWRATEWAKRGGGIIAFALPARIFGRTTGKGFEAWRAMLRSICLTGLINGADLRWTKVWQGIKMPFCLLFARNDVPRGDHRFRYTALKNEPAQNRHARFRIDYEATQPISIERVESQPWVLKTLSLGTWCDVEIVERLLGAFPQTLKKMWETWNPKKDKTGIGYHLVPDRQQKPAGFLGKMLVFEPPEYGFSIQYDNLGTYFKKHGDQHKDANRQATAYWPKTETLYQPPLVIIPKAPGEDPNTPKAFLASRAVAFSQSYYGYSCAGHSDADTLAALLFIVLHSSLFRYFVLMVSVSQGSDHMIFTKQDLDVLSFPEPSKLSASEKVTIEKLAYRLEHESQKPWVDIDSFLFRLYGLGDDAAQIARDTLFSAAAYRKEGRAALERTTRQAREPFRAELIDALEPYFDVCGEKVLVEEPRGQPDTWEQPWFFLAISRAKEPVPVDAGLLREAMKEANKRSASRIIVRAPDRRGLLIGLLNQRRWWTITRARLCGQHIVRHHLEAFGLTQQA